MAKLSRIFLKIFGGEGPTDDFAKFGSQTAGSPVKTKSVSLIQALDAWINGWRDAVVAGNRAPFLEDMNAVMFVHSYMAAYLLQEGIPEWDTDTEYFLGSVVKKTGTFELYGSLADNNQGNALPSATTDSNWRYLGSLSDLAITAKSGIIQPFGGAVVPLGYLLCDGAAVSRATYASLFATLGTVWGVGDGSTTFNLPDLRGKSLFGKAAAGTFGTLGASGGAETHVHGIPHTHEVPLVQIGQLNVGSGSFGQAGTTGGSSAANSGTSSNVSPFAVINYIIKT